MLHLSKQAEDMALAAVERVMRNRPDLEFSVVNRDSSMDTEYWIFLANGGHRVASMSVSGYGFVITSQNSTWRRGMPSIAMRTLYPKDTDVTELAISIGAACRDGIAAG